MKKCVFAGSFDPITKGHEEIINALAKKYGGVLVVVGINPQKTPLFSEQSRLEFINKTFTGDDKITAICYSNYADNYADFLQKSGVKYYARGIRNKADKAFEKAMEKKNKLAYPNVKTVYYKTKKYQGVSSSLVREKLLNGENIEGLVPSAVKDNVVDTFNGLKKD